MRGLFVFVCFTVLFCNNSYGQYGQGTPSIVTPNPTVLDSVGIDQKMGDTVPLDLLFQDESGQSIRLGAFFKDKPVILVPAYYECPMLCTQVLNGLLMGLRPLSLTAGVDFELVTFSIDPNEGAELAAAKKIVYNEGYGRNSDGWRFLTGDFQSIKTLTDAIGYHFAHDPETDEYIHASGIMIVTPQGKLARYLFGVEFAPRDIKLGLLEASEEKIGTPIDTIFLYCFQYNPLTGKYSLAIYRLVRIAGGLTVLGLIAMIVVFGRKYKQRVLHQSV
jgi:protein SCO1/2